MRALLVVLFAIAWAAVAFAVLRALVIVWLKDRRIATVTAFAVAAAFVLGAESPLALARRGGEVPLSNPGIAREVSCPSGAVVAAGKRTGLGHIDGIRVDEVAEDVSKPIVASAGLPIQVGGWVAAANGPASTLCVVVDGKVVPFAGSYGGDRPDVAAAMGKPADRASGFDVEVHLQKGSHILLVAPVQADGKVTPVDQPITLRVN